MILQALTGLFEDLVQQGKLSKPGWSPAKISYALCLDSTGALTYVVPLLSEKTAGKKTKLIPKALNLPSPVVRPGESIRPNFLWDNASYILGADEKRKREQSRSRFQACVQLHHQLLDDVSSPAAKAILAFFDSWQPELARDCAALADCWQDLMKGANLIFRVDGRFAQDDPLIRAAWDSHYGDSSGEMAQCLVTGRADVVEPVHPAVKGVVGAQSSGAALVSFNESAFCSYGKKRSLNAPVGKYAAFAYTAALNYLLSDRENVHRIGDTTVVCWAEGAEPQYSAFFGLSVLGNDGPDALSSDDLRAALNNLAQGLPCEELKLDPNRPFYILGLAPNAARLSVRFFYRDSFGMLMRNVNEHHKRMDIVGKTYPITPLWALLRETVRKPENGQKPPEPNPVLTAATARTIFLNLEYPFSLLTAIMNRIHVEQDISPIQAAILKAYLLALTKKRSQISPGQASIQIIQEVAQVDLNRECTDVPYLLGRLFAVMERIQLASANWELNQTIKKSFFSSATNSTAYTFKKILQLGEYHMIKLNRDKPNLARKLEAEKVEILCKITFDIPVRLSIEESTRFYLGYYHQQQLLQTKKEDK